MASSDLSLPPTSDVLTAFGGSPDPERLHGGRGLTWRAGRVVLRPAGEHVEAEWKSEMLERLDTSSEFTVPRPLRTVDGAWVCDGWEALKWVPGHTDPTRVVDVARAGLAFHRALEGVSRPDFIATSKGRWSVADRMAWGEAAAEDLPADPLLESLTAEYGVVETASQVIHGDLLGNVLFAPGTPPAIIDWAPYWRPSGYGVAVAVADCACWHGVPVTALADDHGVAEWRQLLIRALVFRIATQHLAGRWDEAFAARHEPVAEAVLALPE